MRDGIELLIEEDIAPRGVRMLKALQAAAPPGTVVTRQYAGAHRLLVLYGVGLPARMAVRRQHLAAGGHVAMWDLGYWNRDEAMRLAIDSFHPTAAQLAATPDVAREAEFRLREDADRKGAILLIGIGVKSCVMLGLAPLAWERARVDDLRARYPGRLIHWRPKGPVLTTLPGTIPLHGMPIEEALRHLSLVVCRHSNVAVDACIAGIPVECEDGAARSLYCDTTTPTVAQRAAFLRRLSWWNWRPADAADAWTWMQRMTA